MELVIILALLGAALWFWFDSLAAREIAIRAGSRACSELNLQFLDQSVAVARLGAGRNPYGQLQLRRVFTFDYSSDGADRWRGRVVVLGRYVESITLDHHGGTTIL
jgi:hypothetical protein